MFSCEICKIYKNTYFEEHQRTTSSIKCFNLHGIDFGFNLSQLVKFFNANFSSFIVSSLQVELFMVWKTVDVDVQ